MGFAKRLLGSRGAAGAPRVSASLVYTLSGGASDGGVKSLHFTPDGQTVIASFTGSETMRLWSVETGRELAPLACSKQWRVTAAALSPDGSILAVATGGQNQVDWTIRLWHLPTRRLADGLPGHTGIVGALAFSSDGTRLASGSDDRTLRLWDVADVWELGAVRGRGVLRWPERASSLAFSPDGAVLAAIGTFSRTIWLWDVASGEQRATLEGHAGQVNGSAFSPDGALLASCSSDATIRLWDPATGAHKATLTGHRDGVEAIAFAPHGTTIASGSRDRTVRFWDMAAGKPSATLKGHRNSVVALAFCQHEPLLASGDSGSEGNIRLWRFSQE